MDGIGRVRSRTASGKLRRWPPRRKLPCNAPSRRCWINTSLRCPPRLWRMRLTGTPARIPIKKTRTSKAERLSGARCWLPAIWNWCAAMRTRKSFAAGCTRSSFRKPIPGCMRSCGPSPRRILTMRCGSGTATRTASAPFLRTCNPTARKRGRQVGYAAPMGTICPLFPSRSAEAPRISPGRMCGASWPRSLLRSVSSPPRNRTRRFIPRPSAKPWKPAASWTARWWTRRSWTAILSYARSWPTPPGRRP